MSPSVSIIICTYNGATRLLKTLEHIAKLNYGNCEAELLIIDNNSTDNTRAIANDFCSAHLTIEWRIIEEKKSGLTHARLCGVNNAKGRVLLFCDDDNWLAKGYVLNGLKHLEQHPQLALWGAGISEGVFEVEPAKWATPYLRMLAIFENAGDRMGSTSSDQAVVSGAGMFMTMEFAKRYEEEVKRNPLRGMLDRTGNVALAGGDSDMHHLAYNLGYQTGYFMDLQFQHYMPKERLQPRYFLRLKRNMSFSTVVLQYINGEATKNLNYFGVCFYILKSLFYQPMESLMTIEGLIGRRKGILFVRGLQDEH